MDIHCDGVTKGKEEEDEEGLVTNKEEGARGRLKKNSSTLYVYPLEALPIYSLTHQLQKYDHHSLYTGGIKKLTSRPISATFVDNTHNILRGWEAYGKQKHK